MRRHILVNAIADYYEIEPLKTVANSRIRRALHKNWPSEGFRDVSKAAIKLTQDKMLHEIVATAATRHIDELDDSLLREIVGPCGPSIFRQTMERSRHIEDSITTHIDRLLSICKLNRDALESELSYAVVSWQSSLRASNELREMLDAILYALDSIKACRNIHCPVQFSFNCYIKYVPPDPLGSMRPNYTVRCKSCDCRLTSW